MGQPVAVRVDAAELEQSLGSLLDPPHAALVHAAGHQGFDRALDLTGAEFEISAAQVLERIGPGLPLAAGYRQWLPVR